jgi:hypothetical protein
MAAFEHYYELGKDPWVGRSGFQTGARKDRLVLRINFADSEVDVNRGRQPFP